MFCWSRNTCLNSAFNVGGPLPPLRSRSVFETGVVSHSSRLRRRKKKTIRPAKGGARLGGREAAGGDEHRRWTQLDAHFSGPPHPGEGPPCSHDSLWSEGKRKYTQMFFIKPYPLLNYDSWTITLVRWSSFTKPCKLLFSRSHYNGALDIKQAINSCL